MPFLRKPRVDESPTCKVCGDVMEVDYQEHTFWCRRCEYKDAQASACELADGPRKRSEDDV